MLARKLPMTLQLGLMALLLSWIIAIPIGILSAVKQDTPLDYIPRFISIIGLAIPNFWLGILILTFAAAWFNWFPPIIYQTPWDDPVVNLTQLFFPCLVLGASQAAIQVRMMRTTMLEVLREDYIRTANAKGLKKLTVLWRHAMKNALIPVITISGSQLAHLIGGALVTETVFNLPGIGKLFVQGVAARDYPVIQAIVMFIALIVLVANLVVDLLYAWLDPRIRYT
jgi:peptide/nickel transport system permease protein